MSYVLVLSAATGVPDAAVAAARSALALRGTVTAEPVRLAPTAVEIGLLEGAQAGPAADLLPGGAGIDGNIVPAEGRRKKLLIADMDSTIIGVECIDELADFAGLKAEVAAITKAAMRGELDFEAALRARVALLEGLPENVLQACYAERVRLNPGARVLVQTMAASGADTALVSGGFTYFTERVAAAAGFAANRANTLVIAYGRLTGEVGQPVLGRRAKLEALRAHVARAGISAADVLAVGDGANDIDMVTEAGLGVAYRAQPALEVAADARLEHSDLTALLALQGIPATEWRGVPSG